MKEELAEGRFTADGTYTANAKDPLADHDVWLSGVSKRAIRAAREAKERMDARQREREAEEASRSEEQLTQLRDDCMIGLLALVRPGETVARALTRLGKAKTRADERQQAATAATSATQKGKGKADDAMDLGEDDNNNNGGGDPANSTSTTSPSQRYDKKIDRLTHFASTLLSAHGELEIYDQTYEDIIKTLKSEGAVRRDWVPPTDPDVALEEKEDEEAAAAAAQEKARADADAAAAGSGKHSGRSRVVIARPSASTGGAGSQAASAAGQVYYYKWRSPPPGQPADQEYGPYDRAALQGWIAGGYFGGADAERILVRADGEDRSWREWPQVQ